MIYPVILCGGSGTRLWPLSRKSYPKQFATLSGNTSLFQQTLKRVHGPGFEAPILMTNSNYRFTVQEQAEAVGVIKPSIIIEPDYRNTAPAILSAALKLEDQPDAVMLVMPSDHLIKDEDTFSIVLETAYFAAHAGKLVTFGVKPTRAETGYGYLEVADKVGYEHASALPVSSFVEKPDTLTAEKYVSTGRYLWNSGIFMFKVADILEAFEILAPKLMAPCRRAVSNGVKDLGFFRLEEDAYKTVEDISIDYAVMELYEMLSVVPLDCGWSDMGSWSSVWEEGDADENGVVENGSTTAIDCENTLLRSETDGVELVGIGLKNITAIAMGDAVLVADISQSENVKQAVQILKQNVTAQVVFKRISVLL